MDWGLGPAAASEYTLKAARGSRATSRNDSAPTARSAAANSSTRATARSSTSRATRARRSTRAPSARKARPHSADRATPPLTKVNYRAPAAPVGGTAARVGDGHDRPARERRAREPLAGPRTGTGRRVDRTLGFAHLGGATLDNEENYLIKKLFTALGASRSRTRPESDTPPRCPVWAPRSAAERRPTSSRTSRTPTASGSRGLATWRRTRSASAGSMKANERGATIIHVDPHFTRTSSLSTSTCRSARGRTSPSSAG